MQIMLISSSKSIPLSEVKGEFWGKVLPHSSPNPNWDNDVIYIKQDSNLAILFDEINNRINIIDLDEMSAQFKESVKVVPLRKKSRVTIII